jgi:hypothetical protein
LAAYVGSLLGHQSGLTEPREKRQEEARALNIEEHVGCPEELLLSRVSVYLKLC